MKDHLPLKEMKRKANDFRALENIRKAFTKCTRLSWEESVEKYPWRTKDDRLKQFLGLNFAKSVPQTFVDYCKAAMKESHLQGVSSNTYEGSQAFVTAVNFQEVSVEALQTSFPSYSGANLIISYVPKV